jgi:hypothetical protein
MKIYSLIMSARLAVKLAGDLWRVLAKMLLLRSKTTLADAPRHLPETETVLH